MKVKKFSYYYGCAITWLLQFFLLSTLTPTPAFAETDLKEIIITGTRYQQPLADFGGSVSVLEQQALSTVAQVHIQEVLNRLPGVNLQRNNGQEYLPAVRSPALSGPGACGSFLIMENGVPLRPSGFCNINELFEAHHEQAQRIEVLRGPGTAFHGGNGMHGVINVLNPAHVAEKKRLRLEGGPHDFSRLGLSASSDTLAMSFTAAHDGGYRDTSGYDQQKLSLAHRFSAEHFSADTTVTAINLNQETAGYIIGANAYRDSQLVKTNPNPEAYRDASALRLSSRLQLDGGWMLIPYARYSDMAFLQHFLPGTPLEENGHHSAGLMTSRTFALSDSSELIAGVDLEYANTWLKQTQEGLIEGSAFLQETVPQGKHYDYQVDALTAASFIHWQWQPAESWQLTLGLRYEQVRYDYDNRMLTGRTRDDGSACGFGGCRYSRPADRNDNFGNWSPKFALMYQFNQETRAWLNISRGFRAPQITELYRLQRDQLVADIDSETLTSVELGLRGREERLSYELVIYQMEKENLIFRDTQFFNVSDGKSRHKGLELSAVYDISANWQLGVAASWARHRYDNNPGLSDTDIVDNDIDSAPRHFHNVQLRYQPIEPIQLELEWVQMGRYYTDPENLHSYPGHDLLNLRGQWVVSPRMAMSARVLNLTDKDYAERADFTAFGGDRYFPGEPRSLYVELEFTF